MEKKMTPEIKARVFHHYIGCRVESKSFYEGMTFELVTSNFTNSYDNGFEVNTAVHYNSSLLLTPLSLITDEHLRHCVRIHLGMSNDMPCPVIINGTEKSGYRSVTFKTEKSLNKDYDTIDMYLWFDTENCDVQLNWGYNKDNSTGITTERLIKAQAIYDYLRSLGYALPITTSVNGLPQTWTVEEMVKEGVYKLTEYDLENKK